MFHSRDPKFRYPLGAVAEGTTVHFKITMPRDLACSAAFLIIEKDGAGRKILDMFWCGMNGKDKEWWECDFTPNDSGLYFYHFEAKTNRGHTSLYRGINGHSTVGHSINLWQLTVYDKELTVPDWLAGGIMYQIFPDRFYNSGKKKIGVPGDRVLRKDWGGEPYWKERDPNGEVITKDYFGGDLRGIQEKLPYLKSLGVTCLYLNPIFEAHSNHRYNTADYSRIDPLLGDEDDFVNLCKEADDMGIKILIDGVFSHTGSDSIYFNREERYPSLGAFNSKESPYYPWYNFREWPENYECWWNFDTLPNVKETNYQYNAYINGENGIVQRWLKKGAAGWRLDVADELPDEFICNIAKAAKAAKPDSIILGEVWEDASNKFAYGIRRKYLLGGQLDTVMNYPFRDAILQYLTGEHSSLCMESIETICENYPPQVINLLMNHIGTHDTERAITVLGGDPVENHGREWQAKTKLSKYAYEKGLHKLRLASLLQYTLPGVPCIYYGDEAGMQGYKDPFNRGCYPWGNENQDLIYWYKSLAALRNNFEVFKDGKLRNAYSHKSIMSFERYKTLENGDEEVIFVAVNRSSSNAPVLYTLENPHHIMGSMYTDEDFKLPPYGFTVQYMKKKAEKFEPCSERNSSEEN